MDFSEPKKPRLSADLLQQVSHYIAAELGLALPVERWPELERALAAAAPLFECADAETCAWRLLSTPPSRQAVETLARHLTVGETFFFREAQVFDLLEHEILPPLLAARRAQDKRLRLWSAGCASGEEIYSLAMLLDWLLPDYDEWQITLLATDINPAALEKAAAGIYRDWSFRALPAYLRQRYFTPLDEGRYLLAERLRRRVSFNYLNLSENTYPALLSNTQAMDVIFCRNVLMYFTPERAQQAVQQLSQCLLDQGWLVVSQTEVSHFPSASLEAVNFKDAILYRKPSLWASGASHPWETLAGVGLKPTEITWPGGWPLEGPSADWTTPAATAPAPQPVAQEAAAQPTAAASEQLSPAAIAEHAATHARVCANLGQLTEAVQWCEQALALEQLNPNYHYLSAIIAQERGQRADARIALRRALFLDQDFPVAHYVLGQLAQQDGAVTEAARHFTNVLRLLRNRPATELLREGEGLTVGALRELIQVARLATVAPPSAPSPEI